MSEQKHTPAPWAWDGGTKAWTYAKDANKTGRTLDVFDLSETGEPLKGYAEAKANARRIVACVNACEGLSTEQLERFPLDSFKDCAQAGVASVVRELELLRAAESCIADLEHYVRTHGPGPDARLYALRAAIAKCKGA